MFVAPVVIMFVTLDTNIPLKVPEVKAFLPMMTLMFLLRK